MMKICRIDDCSAEKHYARGLCRKHYVRVWRGVGKGRWREENIVNKGLECADEGCSRPAACRKLCKNHYLIAWRKENPEKHAAIEARRYPRHRPSQASVEKVERLVAAMAEDREKNYVKPYCKVEGCESPVRARRMCINHYNAEKRLAETHGVEWSVEPDPEEFWAFVKKELKIG